jgi:CubicO group peptidase (beta-lactamase class C family)
MSLLLRLALLILVAAAMATDAHAGRRIALVIGNGAYSGVSPLTNPKNDADLMAKTLQSVGFEVTKLVDADQRTMKQAMLDFGRKLRDGADASLFYYSGHGVQAKGENYLIPVDAAIKDEGELDLQTIDVNAFLQVMDNSASKVNIVILDACRNNPFASSLRSASRGLAMVDAPRGTYIAYSTGPGDVAEDGDNGNSPYTRALAKAIVRPGVKLEDTFKEARQIVEAATNKKQVPWETSSITGDFYFRPPTQVPPQVAQIDRIEKAFNEWLARYSITNASLVIVRNGAIAVSRGYGDYDPRKPVPVASLSKAITGICIAKLVNLGKLRYDTALGDALKEHLAAHAPKDERARTITMAELLTHTSGITEDPSQGATLARFRPYSQPSMIEQVDFALASPLGQTPGSRYVYNNVNYAALGAIIEAVTGEPYDKYCGREVLEAAGIRGATINEDWRVMGAYGGWKMSTEAYAKFLDYLDTSKSPINGQIAGWPKTDIGNGVSYSLGVFMRSAGTGFNFWHLGNWLRDDQKASFGAFFAMLHQGIGVVVTYSPGVNLATGSELQALVRAALQ